MVSSLAATEPAGATKVMVAPCRRAPAFEEASAPMAGLGEERDVPEVDRQIGGQRARGLRDRVAQLGAGGRVQLSVQSQDAADLVEVVGERWRGHPRRLDPFGRSGPAPTSRSSCPPGATPAAVRACSVSGCGRGTGCRPAGPRVSPAVVRRLGGRTRVEPAPVRLRRDRLAARGGGRGAGRARTGVRALVAGGPDHGPGQLRAPDGRQRPHLPVATHPAGVAGRGSPSR